jgi:cell division protease FtsH
MISNNKTIIYTGLFFMVLLGMLLFSSGCQALPPNNTPNIDLSQAITLSNRNNISSIQIDKSNGWMIIIAQVTGDPITIQDAKNKPLIITNGTQIYTDIGDLNMADLKEMGFIFPARYSIGQDTSYNIGAGLQIIYLFVPLIFGVMLIFLLRRFGGRAAREKLNDFTRSKPAVVTGNLTNVTFEDVAGVPEAKQDLREIVDFLKNRQKFQRLGARVPKGVLLVGPPGTGKTLLAKAVAGEAGVPFFSTSGSEFVEIFVGVGASRVRDLFQQAKSKCPAIIFIDEIDAVGRKRNTGFATSHEEREQTLNQILSEMDGFSTNIGVIVLAATNRVDVLDPALLRPGRFDRRVTLDNPDTAGRKAILLVHIKGKPLDNLVDLDILAKQTAGFSGADLANLVNEAAIMAARKDRVNIGMEEFGEAVDRVIAGPARRSRAVNLLDKKRSAYHEAGHALVAHLMPDADPVFKVSIVARGGIGGYTRTLPEEEHYLMTKEQLKANLATLLAGYAAEEMVFTSVSTGTHNDLKQATELARRMIMDFGMSGNLSLRTFGKAEDYGFEQKDYSEQLARKIDNEIDKLIDAAHDEARKILSGNRPRLNHLAEKLIELENLEGPELEKAFSD